MIILNNELTTACIDIDGVLCRDPYPYENANHNLYVKFLKQVQPNFQTNIKLGILVSARLEKYRDIITNWLKQNNFNYTKLELLNFPDEQTRDKMGHQFLVNYKSNILNQNGFNYFVQSNYSIAKDLKRLNPSAKIYCTDTNSFL